MITRIVMPNIVGGILSAAFVSVALVLGEFTIASLLHYDTMPVVLGGDRQAASASVAVAARVRLDRCSPSLLLLGAVVLQPQPGPPTSEETSA